MTDSTVTHTEVETLEDIVIVLDRLVRDNVGTLSYEDLGRLSQAHAKVAFLLERARRQAGRKAVAA